LVSFVRRRESDLSIHRNVFVRITFVIGAKRLCVVLRSIFLNALQVKCTIKSVSQNSGGSDRRYDTALTSCECSKGLAALLLTSGQRQTHTLERAGVRREMGGFRSWGREEERKKTRRGASCEVMHSWQCTGLARCAHFPTQMRPFPEAEVPSGELRALRRQERCQAASRPHWQIPSRKNGVDGVVRVSQRARR
jgi:hypothetical protein